MALIEDEDAREALLTTRPTTLAGCAAVLRYVASYDADHAISLFDLADGATFMRRIADAIEALATRA